ncbi:uncharacterized protein [Macrobrachium rosenbergii]|uniref:uncharacterized protein n=1 Tax=Macrobrachium rosenbergii TaxID=79674 RepID=UPI0034D54BFA
MQVICPSQSKQTVQPHSTHQPPCIHYQWSTTHDIHEYSWTFIMADMTIALLGADFLTAYNLLVDVASKQLIQRTTPTSYPQKPRRRTATTPSPKQQKNKYAHLQQLPHYLLKRYFQVPVAKEDKEKTMIITPFGTYTFNYSCFNLRNAGATFQRPMD